ncbi:MAG: TolC family protein [Opitutaceae bacterium]
MAELPAGVSLDGGLDESNAVTVALWNNAAFQENVARLGLARADLAQAGMLANPTLSMLFPLGPKQLEFAATLPLEALWLRPKRQAIAEVEAERVAQGLVQTGLDLVRDVKAALSDYALAVDREAIGVRALEVREQLSSIAASRLRLRDISELDATSAQVERERARDDARRFTQERAILRERLAALLGWPLDERVAISVGRVPVGLPPLAMLETKALAARPDLRASELALEAAGKRAGLAQAEVFTLSGIIDANAKGSEGFEMGPGVSLPIPIFNQNQPAKMRAQAELERARWNYWGVRQRIAAEVRESRLKVEAASGALTLYEQRVLPPMEELGRVTRSAFELGEISPQLVQENARQMLLVQLRRAELLAELRRAWAELERSVGVSAKYFINDHSNSP